jgi:hypothetical protein
MQMAAFIPVHLKAYLSIMPWNWQQPDLVLAWVAPCEHRLPKGPRHFPY